MKNKIEIIEDKLSEILKTSSIDDYLNLIENNSSLKKYDSLMSKIDNGEYPEEYLKNITESELDNIIIYLKIN